jgi:hypothetical protein
MGTGSQSDSMVGLRLQPRGVEAVFPDDSREQKHPSSRATTGNENFIAEMFLQSEDHFRTDT